MSEKPVQIKDSEGIPFKVIKVASTQYATVFITAEGLLKNFLKNDPKNPALKTR